VAAQLDGAVVGGEGLVVPAGAGQQVGPDRVVGLVGGQRLAVEHVQGGHAGGGALPLADRHRPVERHHSGRAQGEELVVEGHDLPPVGGGGGGRGSVHGGDGGLELEGPGRAASHARRHEGAALGDQLPVPPRAVLV